MHLHDADTARLVQAIVRYSVERVRLDPVPLDAPLTPAALADRCGPTITVDGLGGHEALRLFAEVLAPACISVDHPRYLSFVPCAPTEAAVLFDLVVGASSIYGGSWLEGSGAVYAENAVLAWLAGLAGLDPERAGGAFVSGGTAGNLSALVAARWAWRHPDGPGSAPHPERVAVRGLIVTSSGSHSSVAQAARVMDCDVVEVPADPAGRMTRSALTSALDALSPADTGRVCAIAATAGTTNAGVIDDIAAAAWHARRLGTWLHVDAAYGGAGLLSERVAPRYAGIEAADSIIVDPHKWLFAPYDCCALIYRDPQIAKAAHAQHAEYLDVLHHAAPHGGDPRLTEWNPSDYAHHLSRRARGLPLWFSLAAHGTAAYAEAVETTIATAHAGAELIRAAAHLELVVEPELSVVVFRRVGWGADDYQAWSDRVLAAGDAFVVPTSWDGEPVLRICIVNPRTTPADIQFLIDSLT